jgi:hypothetical protein
MRFSEHGSLLRYDNQYIIGNGYYIAISGTYEAQ